MAVDPIHQFQITKLFTVFDVYTDETTAVNSFNP